jgi:hypothetical protein
VHVRRALLLFAIVLGLAALAAAVSQPRQEPREPQRQAMPAPTTGPGTEEREPAQIEFRAEGHPRTKELKPGRPATVLVQVPEPGEVNLEGLGLVSTAGPLTAARFEVLAREPGRHRIRFTPAGSGGEATTAGVLVIVSR